MMDTDTFSLIDQLAASQGIKEEARRKWRERRKVPHKWRLPLSEAARALGKAIDPAAFDQFAPPAEPQEAA